jgi:pyrimidine deaminase RibD-like protein
MIQPEDFKHMEASIAAASKSAQRNKREDDPRVGAVLVKGDNEEPLAAYRSQENPGDHAEFTLLQIFAKSTQLTRGSTLYTTLEPCTVKARSHQRRSCCEWIVEKGIKRVVIGLLDPNPTVCGKGYWFLVGKNIEVDFYPFELAQQIIQLNQSFIQSQSPQPVSLTFAKVLERCKHDCITPFPGHYGFETILELQSSPDPREGWRLSEIEISRDQTGPAFEVPDVYKREYERYFEANYDRKRFWDDGEKFMLIKNPVSWEEASNLRLDLKRTKYSVQNFYRDQVATRPDIQRALIRGLVDSPLEAHFAHTCSLQLIVVTNDGHVLLTKRHNKSGVYTKLWSCSLEEDLHPKDFSAEPALVMTEWMKRALKEELGLTTGYRVQDCRVLSVFLEALVLNICLCGYVELNMSSEDLNVCLSTRYGDQQITDQEVSTWEFLELRRSVILEQLFRSKYEYHPSSRYRLLKLFVKAFGQPTEDELRDFAGQYLKR